MFWVFVCRSFWSILMPVKNQWFSILCIYWLNLIVNLFKWFFIIIRNHISSTIKWKLYLTFLIIWNSYQIYTTNFFDFIHLILNHIISNFACLSSSYILLQNNWNEAYDCFMIIKHQHYFSLYHYLDIVIRYQFCMTSPQIIKSDKSYFAIYWLIPWYWSCNFVI